MVQLSHLYMTTGKTIALTIGAFVHKVTYLLLNTLSRFVITSLPRSKCLISWLQSQSTVILEPQDNKICHFFQLLPFYLPRSDGTGCHDLSFVNVEFQASFFTLLFHPHQDDLSSSFLSAFRVVSSAYQWLLIFLPEILIPACDFSSLAFHMIHSPYKLNKQRDNIQPWHTHFPILNQSTVPCMVLFLLNHKVSQESSQDGLVCLSVLECSTICCDPHSQRLSSMK